MVILSQKTKGNVIPHDTIFLPQEQNAKRTLCNSRNTKPQLMVNLSYHQQLIFMRYGSSVLCRAVCNINSDYIQSRLYPLQSIS